MRKKNYKGVKCTKRYVEKCEDVCKTYDAIQYRVIDRLGVDMDQHRRYEVFDRIYEEGMREKKVERGRNSR